MRNVFILLLGLVSMPACAGTDVTQFEGVQQECAQVGDITFGNGGRWSSCRVTRGRWVATLDFMDIYQAQYCLAKKNVQSCDQRALVIFSNRAYTPDAKVLLVRIDDGATSYDDPMVVASDDESIMSISVRNPENVVEQRYYLWRADRWVAINAQDWLRGLPAYLPDGAMARDTAWPDLETMSAKVNLFKAGDADCCPSGGVANVELALVNEHFAVKQVKVNRSGE